MTFQADHNKTDTNRRPIHKLIGTLNELINTMQPNGAILIAINNEVIYEQYCGHADISKKIATSSHTQYLIGSVTKQFTAVALLNALYEKAKKNGIADNKLEINIKTALQKTVANYLPKDHDLWKAAMPAWANTVTLHHLLIHSSGIPDYTSLPGFENQQSINAADLITFFKTHALEFIPGTKFTYSNSGYFLLGMIIQQLTSQPLDVY